MRINGIIHLLQFKCRFEIQKNSVKSIIVIYKCFLDL